ncbi:ABC transporter permease [Serpentinicella alkaliphila]|uniref:Nucleoside ABC transporter membrane protein n=1 Tax=Serpentinicella alkaliphila TaxID=1734049 RepID=A0A4R2T145_9FIRM|nr:ABC transporter permease [Serpentinicella alkaliphila]QUH27143.1 ABC transporter permease [Serpentinicella alkaliphila]TCP95041.1 nucleoside ABC transporter membrane protein [Serpentinicella alkaliphila]
MFKLVKRSEVSKRKATGIKLIAILLALLTSAFFIMILDLNPMSVYISMINGAFGSAYRTKETIIKAIPLIISALGISIAFRMQFWNIGGEGQIMIGALSASFVALNFSQLPKPILLSLMITTGIIGGGLWALIPAFLKAKWGTNETIVTLMMNYIAIKWVTYLQYGPWKDPNSMGFPKIANFTDNAILPKFLGVHIGWIFALALVIFTYIFMKHSKKGYEIAVLGESENTARYAGINIQKTIITAMILSGGFSGLVGMIQASAVNNTLSVELSAGVGFTAIIVAWLSALKAPVILIVSILFAALLQGGSFIQTAFGIPQAAALLLQGMILFFVLGSEFFVRFKFERISKSKNDKQEMQEILVGREAK